MTSTPRKPLWRWEPGPYVLLIVLIAATVSVRGGAHPVAHGILFVLAVLATALVGVLLAVDLMRGARNPDSAGMLMTVDGLELVPLPSSDAPRTPVTDTNRHQGAIDSAQSRAGATPVAVLVPDATRWLALRIRIAVHLVVPGKVYHVGFLPDQSTVRYNEALRALAAQRRFVSAPAYVIGAHPFRIELDLGALAVTLSDVEA